MRVYTFERRARRRIRFLRGREGREQDGEALLRLRVPEGRVQACERRVAYDVDVSAPTRSASAFNPRSRTKEDASAHFGVWSFRGGRGAEASSVAIRR